MSEHRNLSRWLRRIFAGAFALVLLTVLIVAWMPKPILVESLAVTRNDLRVSVDEDGVSRVRARYVISAPLTGTLARIPFEAGDTIKQGQVIAHLVPAAPPLLDARGKATAEARLLAATAGELQVKAQVERASATAEQARRELARLQQLNSSGALTRSDLEKAYLAERAATADLEASRFAARVATHEVEMSRTALRRFAPGREKLTEEMRVTAPVSGRVLKVMHSSEAVVQPGTPLFEIGDPTALEIVADVLTIDAVRIPVGASVVIDGWGGEALEGRVRRVEPSAFTRISALGVEEQRVNVLVDLMSSTERWAKLGDGYRVEVRIAVWENKNVVTVPHSALFRSGETWAVYRIENGSARLTQVTTGQRTLRDVEIIRGLDPGARVILHPSDQLHDGAQVRTR